MTINHHLRNHYNEFFYLFLFSSLFILFLFILFFLKFFILFFFHFSLTFLQIDFFFFFFFNISVSHQYYHYQYTSMSASVYVPNTDQEKILGKVSILNGDGSTITTGTIVPVGQRSQTFGRITMTPQLKIKSSEDGVQYDQADWISKYNSQIKRESVYASDPVAAKAYAENVEKAVEAARTPRIPQTPQTPRPRQMPMAPIRRTVFGFAQPPPSSTPINLTPLPFKFDLPPLPPMITPPRLI
jgi:hypothetical protein